VQEKFWLKSLYQGTTEAHYLVTRYLLYFSAEETSLGPIGILSLFEGLVEIASLDDNQTLNRSCLAEAGMEK
jgi:hypothetical protein